MIEQGQEDMRFLYVVDPMCGWCYGFQPELEEFLAKYPFIKVDWVMGGLAPDNNQPMEEELQQTISSYWHKIEATSRVSFNHDFWQLNTPYRSTYPACRSVIAAESLVPFSSQKMVKAIQSAYYQEAKNPSLTTTLIQCANSIGLDERTFLKTLDAKETDQQLQEHLNISRQLDVTGFPALFYIDKQQRSFVITLGFCKAEQLEYRFNQVKLESPLL